MAEPAAKDKRKRTPNKPNIYCLFASQQSLEQFQAYRVAQAPVTKPTPTPIHTEHSDGSASVMSFNDKDQASFQLTPVPKVLKIYHCRKCFKELVEQERLEGICEECICLQQLTNSSNFQKFIMYLLEWKAKPLISLHSSKMRRMDSIQSIQSFTLDKPQDSQIRNNFAHNNIKNSANLVFNSMENSPSPTKNSLGDSVQSGYYCNGCAAEPIVGRRFHCLTCDDFDLCEKCYFYTGHKHDMKTFKDLREEITNRTQKTLRRYESLQNTLPFLSSSIRDFEKATKQLSITTALKRI